MNRDRHRLVFNDRLGIWVPVAEHLSARGKRSRSGRARTVIAAALAALSSAPVLADRALPVQAAQFIAPNSPGSALNPVVNGTRMTITQTSSAPVLLQWNSFDIARGHSVHFDQSSASMRAVNVVLPGGPRSELNGSLSAKGQVFLFNQAGILFGPSAQVDVGGLVASTLKLNDKLIESALNSLGASDAALSKFSDGGYAAHSTGDITVARGARIIAAKNGRVLLAAPNVTVGADVDGTLDAPLTPAERAKLADAHIEAEEGQVVLAAGEKVYIADPLDSRLRGFLVEVNNGGKVTTESASQLLSDRGNITLVGLNIRHGGSARATTSVTLNGTVFLKARDGVTPLDSDTMFPDAEKLPTGEAIPVGQHTGSVELAAGSDIDISPDQATKDATVRDDVLFRRSEVNLFGRRIVMEDAAQGQDGARIHAPSGVLRMGARYDGGSSGGGAAPRVYIGRGAEIDLSGVDAQADAGREIVRVELRGNELKDSLLLRDAAYGRALFGKEIWVDTRLGTQLADISGYLDGIERTVAEKSASGGRFVVQSDGDVLSHNSSRVDLSGGTVTYKAGTVNYSVLKWGDGYARSVESAKADRVYSGAEDRTRSVAAVVEGRDAGSMSVSATGMALDGRVVATRTIGLNQRELASRWVGPGVKQSIGVPQAGSLTLSLANMPTLQSARFVAAAPTRALSADAALPEELLLRSDLFDGGIGQFTLGGIGAVTLPEAVSLTIAPGGRYDAEAKKWVEGSLFAISATSFNIDGDIRAAGGTVRLSTDTAFDGVPIDQRNIVFGTQASISTAGNWVRDSQDRRSGHVAIGGGSIVLDARGDLSFPAGAALDVSGGAWRRADGSIALGDAGDLSLLAGSVIKSGSGGSGALGDYYGTLSLGGALSGYSVARGRALSDAGQLSLRSAKIVVDGRDTHNEADGTLHLGLSVFDGLGFEKLSVHGGNGVSVGRDDGATLVLAPQRTARQLGALPSQSLASLEEQGALRTIARAYRDSAMELELLALSNLSGTVDIGRGATVRVDAGGRIDIRANRAVRIDGTLAAPGGRIDIAQDEPKAQDTDLGDFYRGASILLSSSAVLDTQGVFLANPYLSYADGRVFDGGQIGLNARRGFLVMEEGSRLNADGISARLMQAGPAGGALVETSVQSNGGQIRLAAREGLYADATLSARAGGSAAQGGSLSVLLQQGINAWADPATLPAPLTGPRVLDISQHAGSGSADLATAIRAGQAPDAAYAGRGALALDRLANSGIVDVELGAVDTAQYGALRFTGDVDTAVAGNLVLNAANILGSAGAQVRLQGDTVEWRNTGSAQRHHAQATTRPGSGEAPSSLTLTGELLTVSGNLAASGFSSVALNARGDLRANAAAAYFTQGSTLATSGDLTLTAAQIYPTSGSTYSFEIQNNPDGVLRVAASGATPGPVYSAQGTLNLVAPHIVQAGRVVAPLGHINLLSQQIVRTSGVMASATRSAAADGSVSLEAGSLTSVSADGLLLPFGQTRVSGSQWTYDAGNGEILTLDGTPQKAVTLNAAHVAIKDADTVEGKAQARIDLSGGGDILAWEWIPGSGGSTDILSKEASADTYAIVPSLGTAYAPFDTAYYGEEANGLTPGQAITLQAGANGLAAGTYTLLPARYALLPGAFLVKVARHDTSLAPGQSQRLADGTALVSARDARIDATGTHRGGTSFVAQLIDASQVRQRAEYLVSTSTEVFDDGRSTGDAGRLSLQVGKTLALATSAGALDTHHAQTARGAQVDISALRLAVLGEGASKAADEVGVQVAWLNALNAESLVLGGTRSGIDTQTGAALLDVRATGPDGLSLYGATQVRLDNAAGPALQAPDVVLAARERVEIGEDSRIEAIGVANADSLRVVGQGVDADGALLRATNGEAVLPQRQAPVGSRGTLVLGRGARINARSIVLDSTRDTLNGGATIGLPQQGGTLAMTGSTLSVGEVDPGVGGLVFDNAALAALGNPSTLILKSYGSLDLYGDVTLGSDALQVLRIDAMGIGGYRNAGLTQRLKAAQVEFGSGALAPSAAADFRQDGLGTGALSVDAARIVLGATPAADGAKRGFAVRGYEHVEFSALQGLSLAGHGDYLIAAAGAAGGAGQPAASVQVHTPSISAQAGADTRLDVSGSLQLWGTTGATTPAAAAGGSLAMSARSMAVYTTLALPAGNIALTATGTSAADGSLTLGTLYAADGSVLGSGRILAGGVVKDYLGKTVSTAGGQVSLASVAGDVRLQSGGRVDVSAATAGADAGSVTLSAPQGAVELAAGTLVATASGAGRGGSLTLDTRALDSLDALAAQTSDFSRRWAVRVREQDTRLGTTVRASDIAISADAGSLTMAGHLDASGADKGGRIELSARRAAGWKAGDAQGAGDVVLGASARLDARATTYVAQAEGTQGEGGSVLIEVSPMAAGGQTAAQGGRLRIDEGARIDVGTTASGEHESAARKGEITLRAERVGSTGLAIDGNVAAAVEEARAVFVEGTRIYESGSLNMASTTADSAAFMSAANVTALRAALGLPAVSAGGVPFHVRPHVEFRSSADFSIGATDLAGHTYLGGTEAGSLTVRAAGTVAVNGTLSDGFGKAKSGALTNLLGALGSAGLAATTYFDLGTRETAWNIRLSGGADLGAARAGALLASDALAEGKGDVVVAANAQVRTGAGHIDIAAGRDLQLKGASSAIYTAGYQEARGTAFDSSTALNIGGTGNRRAEYASHGGNVSLDAQRDIVAAENAQTVGNWLFRQGTPTDASTVRTPTWYARIDQFQQGVATFGGGDIRVSAGRNIDNLGLSTASNGRLFDEGGTAREMANLKVLGGGDIEVRAGGDVGSAMFYVDRGRLQASAGGAFDSARTNGAGSVLVLGDASARLQAAGGVDVETIASATLVEQLGASKAASRESYFVSYGSDNRVDLLSLGGSVTLSHNATPWGSLALWLGGRPVLPASLNAVAMGGDVKLGNGMVLMSSTYNDLLLGAARDIDLSAAGGGGSQIKVADIALSNLPGVLRPAGTVNDRALANLLDQGLVSGNTAHDKALNDARSVEPVRLIAEGGDISVPFNSSDLLLTLYSPQPVRVQAGGDIRNFAVRAQHVGAEDLSRIRAGGDIVFDAVTDASGTPLGTLTEGILVGGRGKLEVIAGGSIDLGNSLGIVTRGNYDNPALPEQGASILVQAGAQRLDGGALLALLRPAAGASGDLFDETLLKIAGTSDLAALLAQGSNAGLRTLRSAERSRIATLLAQMDARILAFMKAEDPTGPIGDAELMARFDALPAATRATFFDDNAPLVAALLNAGLSYAGQLGDRLKSGKSGYAPGYALIEAAFGEPAGGHIDLSFSQVKSEQGGDVNLYAPGGAITVGVAGAGASTADASRQGIFAIGAGEINALAGEDFQLGPSRAFTLGGGDIQIWSSRGNIDAGKGSSTASATPPPQVVIRGDQVVLDISASVSGSGIGTLKKSDQVRDADIRLFAPVGAVIAADAGIRASGGLKIGAERVIGDNFRAGAGVSGSATVVGTAAPPPVAPPPSETSKAAAQTEKATASGAQEGKERNSILTVEVVGLGDDGPSAGPKHTCRDGEDCS